MEEGRHMEDKHTELIGGADGPTAVFFIDKPQKMTISQRMQSWVYRRRRRIAQKRIRPGAHSLEEVGEYIKSRYGFEEVDRSYPGYTVEYEQMRAEYPDSAIDFHKYAKRGKKSTDSMNIMIERNHGELGGDASGSKAYIRKWRKIYKDIYRYYGVSEDDILNNTQRYKTLVTTLSL